MKLKDSTRRGLRTIYQGIVGLIVGVPIIAGVVVQVSHGDARIAGTVATVIGATAVAAKVLNALEDADLIPAWLKAPASDGANPVPDPNQSAGFGDTTEKGI